MMLVLWSIGVLVSLVWLVAGVWKSSRGWAVATVLLGPLGAVVPTVRQRHDPDTRVTAPFVVHLAFSVLWMVSAVTMMQQAAREEAGREAATLAAAAAAEVPTPVAADDGLPRDPIERFAHRMAEAGLSHTTADVDPKEVPRGAVQALRLTVSRRGDEGRELSGWLLRCADSRACQRLAGSFKVSAARGEPAPQVTQNGMLLLVMPTRPESEGLHHVVQGVFRRTSLAPT